MAELTYKSPGVGVREIDLSGPTETSPTGTPAGVVGTAEKGPAFVPVVVSNFKEFNGIFGTSQNSRFGPVAMYQWLKNSKAGLYVRVLGVGNAKKRTISGNNSGKVTHAGFVVGSELVQNSGDFAYNSYAYPTTSGNKTGEGRTYFLGCFMSESNGSTYFSEAGLQSTKKAVPILRGVLMAPSGVALALSSSTSNGINNDFDRNVIPSTVYGFMTGTIEKSSRDEFVMFLSGHINSLAYPNVITASFDPKSPNYFGNIFNSNPENIERAGYCLYTQWDIDSAIAAVTGTDVSGATNEAGLLDPVAKSSAAFLLTGSLSRNSGSSTVPNFENFEDRFSTPESSWVISQNFGGENYNLFKIHSLDDGAWASNKVKITIKNVTPSMDPTSEYGTFDLYVRSFGDTDDKPVVLESFVGLSINPNARNYVAKVIGDAHAYYDFDRSEGNQKLIFDGLYPNRSKYIRVEVGESVEGQDLPASSLPVGFRGYKYLNIDGSRLLKKSHFDTELLELAQPPIPFRKSISMGTGFSKRAVSYLTWGIQFESVDSVTEPNKNLSKNSSVQSFMKYFPTFQSEWENIHVTDQSKRDDFCNNLFTLENIAVVTSSVTLKPSSNEWKNALYCRDGIKPSSLSRFIQMSDLEDQTCRKYLSFTFGLQGGFDGLNIFSPEKVKMSNVSAHREMEHESSQGASEGSTVAAYRKAIDIMSERSDVDIQLLTTPGMRTQGITDYALDATSNRFDALYIMDVEQYNNFSAVITRSDDIPSVGLTTSTFASRQLDSSFAAAYFPDLVISDPNSGIEMVVPPSVAVLGAFSLNDKVGYPWFAPAGFTRGALEDVLETQTKLNRDNMDTLYSSNINPIATIPGSPSPIVNGQKTLLNRQSALDRINVRRLLIEIRRRVRSVANGFLFEPNRESTLGKFSAAVNPILQQIQAQSGVDRFLVKIDTSTTTQADVENNTIRGKIFVQPTKAIEFVSLDFVVSNSGVSV